MASIRKFLDAVKELDLAPVLDGKSFGVLDRVGSIPNYKAGKSILDKFYCALGIPIAEVSKDELEKYGDVAGVNIGGRAMVADYLAPEDRAAVAAHEAGHRLSMDQRVAQLYAIKALDEARKAASNEAEREFFEKALQSALRSAQYFGIDLKAYRKSA
ncbi:MAG: hypothetical protein QXF55_02775 [Candidatus Aenigmatarchaeota archaeon]